MHGVGFVSSLRHLGEGKTLIVDVVGFVCDPSCWSGASRALCGAYSNGIGALG